MKRYQKFREVKMVMTERTVQRKMEKQYEIHITVGLLNLAIKMVRNKLLISLSATSAAKLLARPG